MEELQDEPALVGDKLQAKNEELGVLKTATDVAKTKLAETTVQNKAALLAM